MPKVDPPLETHCPKCNSLDIHRIKRRGFWQRRVLPLFGIYPWRCSECRKSSYLRTRQT
jgi:predicted RNA-binding Zn-ribbon protein involved in translation (DUF1610 family)